MVARQERRVQQEATAAVLYSAPLLARAAVAAQDFKELPEAVLVAPVVVGLQAAQEALVTHHPLHRHKAQMAELAQILEIMAAAVAAAHLPLVQMVQHPQAAMAVQAQPQQFPVRPLLMQAVAAAVHITMAQAVLVVLAAAVKQMATQQGLMQLLILAVVVVAVAVLPIRQPDIRAAMAALES